MILSLAMSLALTAQPGADNFRHGAFRGHCFREKSLQGQDHELCRANLEFAPPFAGASIEVSAGEIEVDTWGGECKPNTEMPPNGRLPRSAFSGRDRAAVVAAFIRHEMDVSLAACGSGLKVPAIREADVEAVLRESDDLRPGSFVPLDAAARLPAATKCGRELELQWRAAMQAHPATDGGRIGLMMYSFSKGGPDRATKRFDALPEMFEDNFSMGMGPGGVMIDARHTAAPWRDPPSAWFVTVCDIGIEAWSSFVELAYFEAGASSPLFGARAETGVASTEGYAIWSGAPQ